MISMSYGEKYLLQTLWAEGFILFLKFVPLAF
jgi:hypothetical protein